MEEVARRTSLVPLAFSCFVHCLIGVEAEGLLDYQGAGGGSFPLYGGTSARSYSALIRDLGVEIYQGRKRNPNLNFFGPDIFGWGGVLPREGVGAKKFGMSFETQENHTFWRDVPGLCRAWISRGCPKSLRKKGLCSFLVP